MKERDKRIYLDYAASTPVDPRVQRAMARSLRNHAGNPGSLHWFGQQSSAAIFKARRTIADALKVDYMEVLFTGSATEANNLALRGVCTFSNIERPHIIVSSIEHDSVLATAHDLEKRGVSLTYLPVSRSGIVDLKALERALTPQTVLVSVLFANNETGTVQPIKKIGAMLKTFRAEHNIPSPLFHVDAVQAFQYLDCRPDTLGVDLMTLSSHKVYGPKGVGALYVRQSAQKHIGPIIAGGGQEFGFRSGTENVSSIVGFGKAIELVEAVRDTENQRVETLRTFFVKGLAQSAPQATVHGSKTHRLPNIIHVRFPGMRSDDLLAALDLSGVAISSGPACSARSHAPSHVLRAMGYSPKHIRESVRCSIGRPTTKSDLRRVLNLLKKSISHS